MGVSLFSQADLKQCSSHSLPPLLWDYSSTQSHLALKKFLSKKEVLSLVPVGQGEDGEMVKKGGYSSWC
jgi:hypothetical protein